MQTTQKKQAIQKKLATQKKLLIVDGYNVLRSGFRYKMSYEPDYTDDAFNTARERLINDVASFAGRDTSAIIVFDGGNNCYSTGDEETVGGVRIMFSPAGTSADRVIEKLAHDARARGLETLVVTSDASIQETVFGGCVTRMSANGFSREIDGSYSEARADKSPAIAYKRTIAERIDAAALEKLVALRDQL